MLEMLTNELLLLYFSTLLNMDPVICKFTLIFHVSDSLKEGGMIFLSDNYNIVRQ
jgi:hypothetical protein